MKSVLSRLLIVLTYVSLALSSCYSPNGTFVDDDFPCYPDQEDSFCCPPGYACLSNHLCHVTPASPDWYPQINQSTKFSRRGCTDPTWRSPECPSFCRAFNGIAGEGVDLCSAAQEAYCCTFSTDDSCTCLIDNDFVLINNATTVTQIPSTMTGPTTDSLASSTPTRTSSAGTAASSTGSSSSSSSSASSVASLTSSPAQTSTPPLNGNSSGGTNVIAIAVGVVVPVVVIASLIAGYFIWRHRQRSKVYSNGPSNAGIYMGEYRGATRGNNH